MDCPVVDLWVAALPEPLPQDVAARCAAVLTSAERAAAGRFREPGRRDQALVARALARLALSRRIGGAPQAWAFAAETGGRPHLAGGGAWDFNLAHCEGCVVCAVAEGTRVGVDVEPLARAGDIRAVAARVLAPTELAALAALPPEAQPLRLVRLWTLKEAWSKALGDGLGLDFRAIAVAAEGQRFRLAGAPDWRLEAFDAGGRHAVALAVRGDATIVRRDADALLRGRSYRIR